MKKTSDSRVNKSKMPDIVNEFLAMNGRIQFHCGEVTSRRFTGKNTFVEEGVWYGDILENDENQQSYQFPYRLTAVMGEPIKSDPYKDQVPQDTAAIKP